MDGDRIRALLEQVHARKLGVEQALEQLRLAPWDDLGFAKVDLQRVLRRGFPETVFGSGKTPDQVLGIVERLHEAKQTVLVTRVEPAAYEAVAARYPKAEHHAEARLLVLRSGRRRAQKPGILVITAGTSDIPVAEEAAITAEVFGNRVRRIYDVGIAGVHRLGDHREDLVKARVIVTVAGMEGALPSLVAGLTACPVIGVPTSTGYGAGGGGQAALLAMLNSCAPGLTVVNIDNGHGAGVAAALINRNRPRST